MGKLTDEKRRVDMEYLRTEEYGLPNILDRDLPEECQYTKSKDIYRGYRCLICGKIATELLSCCCNEHDFEEVEVDETGEEIEERTTMNENICSNCVFKRTENGICGEGLNVRVMQNAGECDSKEEETE
jgi:hypothetical protein